MNALTDLLSFSGKRALVSMTLSVKNPNKEGTCQIFDVKEFKVSRLGCHYVRWPISGPD